MPTFVVHTPVGVNQIDLSKAIREAVAEATRLGKLRPEFGGFASPARTAATTWATETPVIHFEQWEAGRDRGAS